MITALVVYIKQSQALADTILTSRHSGVRADVPSTHTPTHTDPAQVLNAVKRVASFRQKETMRAS